MPPSRKADILAAAVRVFSEHGFHASGIERVLQEAGVSRMTLYYHFKSKDDLIVAALQERHAALVADLQATIDAAGTDPLDRLDAIFDFHAAWFGDDAFHGCLFLNAAAEFEDPDCAIRRAAVKHKEAVASIITGACTAAGVPDPQRTAGDIHLILEGAIVTADLAGKDDGDQRTPASVAEDARRIVHRLLTSAG